MGNRKINGNFNEKWEYLKLPLIMLVVVIGSILLTHVLKRWHDDVYNNGYKDGHMNGYNAPIHSNEKITPEIHIKVHGNDTVTTYTYYRQNDDEITYN